MIKKAEYLSQHDLPARLEATDRLRSRFDKWPNCFEATVSRPSQLAAAHCNQLLYATSAKCHKQTSIESDFE